MASKILLADDSITIQKVVNLTFADEGIDVVAVSNGELAERRLGEINPDLVLADIFMPGKNGYELCEFIKQSPQFKNIPVVLLVGAFEPFDQVEARRVRADAHLTKPFESRTLVETVRKLITSSGKTITAPLATPTPAAEPPKAQPPAAPDTRPLPSHGVNIDLDAMKRDYPPADARQPQGGTAPLGSAPPSAPFALDDSVFGGPAGDAPLEIQMEAPAQPEQHQASDFSFVPGPAHQDDRGDEPLSAEGLTFGEIPIAIDEEADPFKNLFDSSEDAAPARAPEPAEPFAAPQAPAGQAGPDDQFMIMDFDSVEPSRQERDSFSFDVVASDATAQSPGDTFEVISERHDAPAAFHPAAEVGRQEPSPGATDADFDLLSPGFEFVEHPAEPAPASNLFAVEDPLGDVLMGSDAAAAQASAQTREPAQPSAAAEDSPFDIDIAAPEGRGYGAVSWEQPAEAPATGSEFSFSVEEGAPSVDSAGRADAAFGAPSAGGQDFTSGSMFGADEGGEILTDFATVADVGAGEWGQQQRPEDAVSGFEISESDFHPIDQDLDEPRPRRETGFTASSMWEAGAVPPSSATIDIEAVPVQEPQPAEPAPAAEDVRGFEFTPTPSEAPAAARERASSEEAGGATAAAGQRAGEIELPPALIDEIVRRVVAQMSDAVVREIAWEVVPDCVERVVENLTRESVSKNR